MKSHDPNALRPKRKSRKPLERTDEVDRLLDDLIRKSRASSCLIAALVKGAKIAYFDGREWLPIDNSTLSDTVFYSPSRVILPTRGRFRRRVIFNGISARAYKLPPLEQATLDPTLTF